MSDDDTGIFPRYHVTDRGLEIAAWLSITLPHVRYSLHSYYLDILARAGARGRGILIWANEDDAMVIAMTWTGRW